jgi:hypothetical protein
MVDAGFVAAELESMRQELARPSEAVHAGAASPEAVSVAGIPPLDDLLRELEEKWAGASETAEELVKAHPIVALAAAFIVGMAVGRLMGKQP